MNISFNLKKIIYLFVCVLLLTSFRQPPDVPGDTAPSTAVLQNECRILGFYAHPSFTSVDAAGFTKPVPPVISALPGVPTVPLVTGAGGLFPSGHSAYNPQTDDIIFLSHDVSIQQQLYYYNTAAGLLSASSVQPSPASRAGAPVFLNNMIFLLQGMSIAGNMLSFDLASIDPISLPSALVVPNVHQNFSLGPLNTNFNVTWSSAATNGISEMYVVSHNYLIVLSQIGVSGITAHLIELEPSGPGNPVTFFGLEYKGPNTLMAIRETATTLDLVEIEVDIVASSAIISSVYDLTQVSQIGPFIVPSRHHSTTYDRCDGTYYISMMSELATPVYRLVEINTQAGAHTEHSLSRYFFGIEKNRHCCDTCCDDFLAFQNLVNMGWQIQIDHVNCKIYASAPQLGPCHYFIDQGPASWGDGTQSPPGLTPTTGVWEHTYSQSGTYTIEGLVVEMNGANICWEYPISTTITINCCPDSTLLVVQDTVLCGSEPVLSIPLLNCDQLSPCGVSQVNWYVKPCSATSWPATPYQSSPGHACTDLIIYPNQYPGESCLQVYAQVLMNGSCCGITQLFSNWATVHLCAPVSCHIQNFNPPAPCDVLIPSALHVVFPTTPLCQYDVQWYYQGQAIPGATGTSYQPPQLSFLGQTTDCYYDHLFSVELSGPCGPQTCDTRIRIYNSNAPTGSITMNPLEPLPFCPGEDATLHYQEACAGDPPMWEWYYSTAPTPVIPNDYTLLPGAGARNPVINTNRLYTSTWYAVKKQNGGCPADWVEFFIEVKDPVAISGFLVTADPCATGAATLTLHFAPSPVSGAGCLYEVTWYKDGFVIGTTTSTSTPMTFVYPNPTPGQSGLAGNYYAVIRDNCCTQSVQTAPHTIEPSCVPFIIGPCYKCQNDNSPIVLTAVTVIPPSTPCPSACTYQWGRLIGGVLLPLFNGNQSTMTVTSPGTYGVTVNCGGCITTVYHTITNCGPCTVSTHELPAGFFVKLYPNPSYGELTLQTGPQPLRNARLRVVDVNGRVLATESMPSGQEIFRFSLAHIPAGIYFVQVFENDMQVWIDRIVLQP